MKKAVGFFWALGKVKQVFLWSIGVLIALEVVLRLLGAIYNSQHKLPVDRGANFSVLGVGESTTWGLGASDPVLKGYPRQLEELLNKKYPTKDVQCFFENTIGQNTSENLVKLPKYIKKYDPDLIILMAGANNWWNLDLSNAALFVDTPRSRFYWKTLEFLDQSRAWKFLKNMAFASGLYKERWDFWFPEERRNELGSSPQGADRIVFDRIAAHDLEEMIKICQDAHIDVIMATYPVDDKYGLLFREKKRLAKKYDIAFVDNSAVFDQAEDRASLLSGDGWHPNDKGYALLANNFFTVIEARGLINAREGNK